eukprot:TRINITY_DN4035_c0_g1_i3.p1 TRINITY_DN4035_c0_g1~~TRINITY_DN4035_c0_g1_i3.p1  ORF type:complete len:293 (+),score=2.80 TRINITY_DN4035_c0_g1_i3:215-1093(+)
MNRRAFAPRSIAAAHLVVMLALSSALVSQPPAATAAATSSVGKVATAAASSPQILSFSVAKTFTHSPTAFTEGLVYMGYAASGNRGSGAGVFYESTGMNGESSLREVDVATGKVLRRVNQANNVFSEGIAVVQNRIFQLAYQVKTGTIYRRTDFKRIGSFTHQMTDGWGLGAFNASLLVGTDGTPNLYFISPSKGFKTVRRVPVTDGGVPVPRLNEVEVVDGRVWANVWLTTCIAVIDPASGQVTAWMDLEPLKNIASNAVQAGQVRFTAGDDEALSRVHTYFPCDILTHCD